MGKSQNPLGYKHKNNMASSLVTTYNVDLVEVCDFSDVIEMMPHSTDKHSTTSFEIHMIS